MTASVFHDGTAYRLAVASQATGAGAAITFTEAGAGLGLTEVQAARDAAFTVDGVPVTRASNHVDDVIPGVTFDLAAATSGTTVTVDRDADGQRTRVQALVDAYNAVARVVATQLAYDGTQKGEDTLFGDPTVRALQRGLASMITGVFPSGTSQVAARDVGITIGADGTLTLDAAKLDAAVAADPGKVEDLFGTGGLAGKVDAMVTQMTQSGTGLLVIQQDSLRTRNRSWDDQITRIESAADALGERLRAQYSQLEQAVSAMQSNLSYLTTLFGS